MICFSTNNILNQFISANYSLATRHNDKIDLPACQLLYAVRDNIFANPFFAVLTFIINDDIN